MNQQLESSEPVNRTSYTHRIMASRSAFTGTPFAPPPLPVASESSEHDQIAENAADGRRKLADAVAESKAKGEGLKKQVAIERMILERDLQEKQEGRQREALARERVMSKQRLDAARAIESRNPMTLAELFRCLLFFVNEQLVEEPIPDTPLQFPHLKGEWAENMLVSVYQKYCRSYGFMSLEEFVEFMEDSAILQTHVPHDENDEPLQDIQAQLDPVRLLTTIPRNLGYSRDMETAMSSKDNFCLNFAQFYQLLLRIAHIVYPELYEDDATLALNKLLQESILALYAWTQGHSKRGSTDPLVTEERIVLLLTTYAPNLWKVFLMYCQDYQGKVPELNMPYPESAKGSERVLFGVPYGAPFNHHRDATPGHDVGYFMTESACVRFCVDYGLVPHLMPKKILKDLIRSLNRAKTLHPPRTIKMQQPPTAFFQKTQTTVHREQSAINRRRSEHQPMHFSNAEESRSPALARPGYYKKPIAQLPAHLGNPAATVEENGGLGFSEFVELVSRIAVEGMQGDNYHVLFPTPFSKILALLTVWGIADLRKLEEVRMIRSETLY